jgi:hypothetical protein
MNFLIKLIRSIRYFLYAGRIALDSSNTILGYSRDNKKNLMGASFIICCIDGKILHGGLTDRIRGIVSAYLFCKENNYIFKIYHIYPFELQVFLVPNKYNWIVDKEQVSYNSVQSYPIYINTHDYYFEQYFQRRYLQSKVKNKRQYQIHLYTNANFGDKNFSQLFTELFKPSKLLEQELSKQRKRLGKGYFSFVFRFQQLLGDFIEGNFKILSIDKRESLIFKCIEKLDSFHKNYSTIKFLVTSDSVTFLDIVSKLEYVHIIEGKVVHMDFCIDASLNEYMKSFVDLYMLAESERIYLMKTDEMYHSGFPKRAAMIYNTPYYEIKF